MTHILVFGDSIVFGAWDPEGGWVARLRRFFDGYVLKNPDFDCFVYNLGVSGDTTENLLGRFEPEIVARQNPEGGGLVIVSIGINDAMFSRGQKVSRVTLDRFSQNLGALVAIAKRHSYKLLFLEQTAVDEARVDPIPWKPGHSYLNEKIKDCNTAIRNACQRHDLPCIPIFDEFSSQNLIAQSIDGVHPDAAGHQFIFEQVKQHLLSNRLILLP